MFEARGKAMTGRDSLLSLQPAMPSRHLVLDKNQLGRLTPELEKESLLSVLSSLCLRLAFDLIFGHQSHCL